MTLESLAPPNVLLHGSRAGCGGVSLLEPTERESGWTGAGRHLRVPMEIDPGGGGPGGGLQEWGILGESPVFTDQILCVVCYQSGGSI